MKKIGDKLILGGIAGIVGNIAMSGISRLAMKLGIIKNLDHTSKRMASVVMIPNNKANTFLGKVVGEFSDYIIASGLGVATAYMLSATGKDKAAIKGAGLGLMSWNTLYGAFSTAGLTGKIRKAPPKDALVTFSSHLVFGLVTGSLVATLGDPRIFAKHDPDIIADLKESLSSSPDLDVETTKKQTAEKSKSTGDIHSEMTVH